MNTNSSASIQKALTAIRERQSKATPGKWIISNPDWRKNVNCPFIMEIVPEYSPTKRLVTVSFTAWRPERGKTCQANAEYIAQACSPEGGDLTRLITACEKMDEALRRVAERRHPSGNGALFADISDLRVYASEALAKATAILERKA